MCISNNLQLLKELAKFSQSNLNWYAYLASFTYVCTYILHSPSTNLKELLTYLQSQQQQQRPVWCVCNCEKVSQLSQKHLQVPSSCINISQCSLINGLLHHPPRPAPPRPTSIYFRTLYGAGNNKTVWYCSWYLLSKPFYPSSINPCTLGTLLHLGLNVIIVAWESPQFGVMCNISSL